MAFFNTKDAGPIVVDIPAAGDDGTLNGNIVDIWQMPLEDAGPSGADAGKGGKYLMLPPGYASPVPEGYIALRPATFGSYALLRSNLKSHSDADVAKSVAYGKKIKVYPLSQAADPPATVFTDAANVVFDSTIRYDASFFVSLDRIVQSEPWLGARPGDDRCAQVARHREGQAVQSGRQDQGRAGDGRSRGAGVARSPDTMLVSRPSTRTAGGRCRRCPNSSPPCRRTSTSPTNTRSTHAAFTYSFAFVGIKRLGAGQFYLISIRDKDGNPFDGGKTYRLTVPANPPVEQYWSATAYDRVTHALIRNMPRASRSSQIPEMQKNADGSVDVYFGPAAPAGKETNWVPTDPKRGFEVMFRAYAPTKAFFDKTWKLPDIERVN